MTPHEQEMLDKLFTLHGAIKSPTCAICNKPVDKMEVNYKIFDRKYIIKVGCHGDTCEVRVPHDYALDARYKFEISSAFQPNVGARTDGTIIKEIQ